MEFPAKHAIALLILWVFASNPSAAQREIQKHPTGENVSGREGQVASHTLTPDDGLAVLETFRPARLAHPRRVRETSSASAG
jgi:hypothetical protein